MKWFYSLPRFVRDLIIFNSFVIMVQFLATYVFKRQFSVQTATLMAANVGILIVNLLMHRVRKIKEEEKQSKK